MFWEEFDIASAAMALGIGKVTETTLNRYSLTAHHSVHQKPFMCVDFCTSLFSTLRGKLWIIHFFKYLLSGFV